MAEPISDAGLAEIRHLMESATHVEGEIIGRIDLGSCDSNDVRGLIARLDRAEAALPVLIATIREACDQPRCGFCGGVDGRSPKHTDCPGIAALKAAGVEP